jgi:hypothetical protein
LPFDSAPSPAFSFACATHELYWDLVPFASTSIPGPTTDPEANPSLGGKLLYGSELDHHGRALVVAGNIAGAAILTATADPAAQKQAIRDGVVDFLVTSLDEALRILKNEIRKRETVAVCVAAAPLEIEREMLERGVQPDLHREQFTHEANLNALQNAESALDPTQIQILISWTVASAPAQWLPKLDAIAVACLEPSAWPARRWLHLAPRYLGRIAQSLRLLRTDQEFAARFIERVRREVQRGDIAVQVQVQMGCDGETEEHRFVPDPSSHAG